MITREQYLNALEIIDQYHQQNKKPKIKDWEDLKVGDEVVFEKSLTKKITIGVNYRVIEVEKRLGSSDCLIFKIIDDDGKIRRLSHLFQGYIMRIVQ